MKEYIFCSPTVKNVKPKIINKKWNALVKLNKFLICEGIQSDRVIIKKAYLIVQQPFALLAKDEYKDGERFRQ